jgi:hypothetical protein
MNAEGNEGHSRVDAAQSRRGIARIRQYVAVAALLVLTVGIVATTWRARSRESRAAEERGLRAARCNVAKSLVLQVVRSRLLTERAARLRDGHAVDGFAGMPLAVYVLTCQADVNDLATADFGPRLADLVEGLLSSGEFETLENLLKELGTRPLDEWKTIKLPEAPSLVDRITHGDPKEAALLRKRFIKAHEGSGTAGSAAESP